MEGLVDWVEPLLGLGMMNDFLGVVQHKGTEQGQTSIQLELKHPWSWSEHVDESSCDQDSASHGQGTSHLQELLTWSVVGEGSKGSDSDPGGEHGVVKDWSTSHVDQWDHAKG